MSNDSSIAIRDISGMKDRRYLQASQRMTHSRSLSRCSVASKGTSDPTKKLLSVKMNGVGKYESELHAEIDTMNNGAKIGLNHNIDM